MRRLIVVTILVLLASFVYNYFGNEETGTGNLTLAQPAPNIGDAAPSFASESEEGNDYELADDGVYVLAFWSTLNRQSLQARETFEQLAREYSDDGISFAVVYVNSAPDDQSKDYEVLQDRSGSIISDYNVKTVPRLFMVEDGRIRLVQNGFYPEYEQQLEDEILEYLEESSADSGHGESSG